jgi:hypothetical protein
MNIVLGGKFESALIRGIDEVIQPSRNVSHNGYYLGLNRKVSKNYADRCGTFVTISELLMPSVDWNYAIGKQYRSGLQDVDLGIEGTDACGGEWDEDTRAFVSLVVKSRKVISSASRAHISQLSLSHYDAEARAELTGRLRTEHYLCRLFLQLRAARDAHAFILLSEEDIQLIQEIGEYVFSKKLPTPFDLPDVRGRLIEPDSFCYGLLNFAPPDIISSGVVRSDPQIRKYASKVSSLLSAARSEESHKRSEAGARGGKNL